jgi:hypothetical protein
MEYLSKKSATFTLYSFSNVTKPGDCLWLITINALLPTQRGFMNPDAFENY